MRREAVDEKIGEDKVLKKQKWRRRKRRMTQIHEENQRRRSIN